MSSVWLKRFASLLVLGALATMAVAVSAAELDKKPRLVLPGEPVVRSAESGVTVPVPPAVVPAVVPDAAANGKPMAGEAPPAKGSAAAEADPAKRPAVPGEVRETVRPAPVEDQLWRQLGIGRPDTEPDPAAKQGPRVQVPPVDLQLKRFGYDFFRRDERLPAAAGLPVDADYVLGPGDEVKIDLWGNVEGSYQLLVDRNGDILLPRVGVIHLWGQSFSQATATIQRQVAKYYNGFEINVTLGALRSMQVFLVGEVVMPGAYNVSSLATVLTLLGEAGGVSENGSLRRIEVRRGGQLEQTVDFYDFLLKGDKSGDIRLRAGDTVFVPVVGELVGVAGNVRRPAIYEMNGATSLAAILETAGGIMPTAYLNRVQVERVTAHQGRTVVDLNLRDGALSAEAAAMRLQDRDLVKVEPIADSAGFVELAGHVTRAGRYQMTPGMRVADLLRDQTTLLPGYHAESAQIIRVLPPEYRKEILTFNLGAALAGDPDANVFLSDFDQIRIFSRTEMEEELHVFAYGAVQNPGEYPLYENMRVRDLVTRAGNLKRNVHLEQAEISRHRAEAGGMVTERVLIDLGRAMSGDPAHNLVLAADDHLFVRGNPEYAETRQVSIGGQVAFPGTYAVYKGETLGSVLKRAGGFTPDAYLRGAVFTRDALKEVQQQRLDQLIAEQEQAIATASSELAQTARNPEEVSGAKALLESRAAILKKLRDTRATGRMVVRLRPLAELAGGVDDLALQHGDSLYVPSNPHSVMVLGEVFNPVAMAYRSGSPLQYYLDQVGGPKEDANTDEIFVVRADGTVQSRKQSGFGIRWDSANFRWVAGFGATEIFPGDTILVPQQIEQFDWLREVKDLTTILYQMALGAAAIASF